MSANGSQSRQKERSAVGGKKGHEKETLSVLVVEPQKKPYAKEIGGDLKSLQHEVGEHSGRLSLP